MPLWCKKQDLHNKWISPWQDLTSIRQFDKADCVIRSRKTSVAVLGHLAMPPSLSQLVPASFIVHRHEQANEERPRQKNDRVRIEQIDMQRSGQRSSVRLVARKTESVQRCLETVAPDLAVVCNLGC